MIIEIYVLLVLIALIFVFFGWYMRTDVLRIIGFSFLFLLGVVMTPGFPGSIDVPNGQTITMDNGTYTVANTYLEYQNVTFGFFMQIMGAFGVFLVWMARRDAI